MIPPLSSKRPTPLKTDGNQKTRESRSVKTVAGCVPEGSSEVGASPGVLVLKILRFSAALPPYRYRQQRLLLWVHSWADKQQQHQRPTTNVRIDLKIRNNNVNICKHFTNIFVPPLNDMNIFSQEVVEDFVPPPPQVLLFFRIFFSRCISHNFQYAAVFFQFPAHSRSEAAGQIIHARMHTKRQKGL